MMCRISVATAPISPTVSSTPDPVVEMADEVEEYEVEEDVEEEYDEEEVIDDEYTKSHTILPTIPNGASPKSINGFGSLSLYHRVPSSDEGVRSQSSSHSPSIEQVGRV